VCGGAGDEQEASGEHTDVQRLTNPRLHGKSMAFR
jgi:hypothetical protein